MVGLMRRRFVLNYYNNELHNKLRRLTQGSKNIEDYYQSRTLWAYRTAFKTPLGTTPFHLLYGKPCYLPVEIEHKAAWAIKMMNFDIKSAAERRMIQLNELDEIRHHAYENSKLYKERTKAYHNSKILSRQFEHNDQVLLYNSCPFIVKEVRPYGAIVRLTPDGSREFTMNGQRVKHYWAKAAIQDGHIVPLDGAPTA
ncbi:uncharacterized protein LOC112087329 [Eutrema salsugineum]|uniref:uncharacterized protein LOC112087329 n=1 Tax=Eutrema salsugineum TaxID=72664 RepID=UPI000CECE559|nr:uncharacterized protein LOC112087329 [Eutrema salsugineum]